MLARQPKSGRYRDLKRKQREHRYPDECSSGALPVCAVVPPARRVWLDWTAAVAQPQNGLALFVIEISCLSLSIAVQKNA
jgi:hypothetical protein